MIKDKISDINDNNKKVITVAEGIIRENKKCEEKLLVSLGLPIETTVTNTTFTAITLDQMSKGSAAMLGAFIKNRLHVNLTERCVIATKKGTPIEVRRGDVDKKNQRSVNVRTGPSGATYSSSWDLA